MSIEYERFIPASPESQSHSGNEFEAEEQSMESPVSELDEGEDDSHTTESDKEKEPASDMSRRDFLKKAGKWGLMTIVAGELAKFGIFAGETRAEPLEDASPEQHEQVRREIREMIERFAESEDGLTEEKIRAELSKCGFIEGDFQLQHMAVPRPVHFASEHDAFKEANEAAQQNNSVQFHNDALDVVSVPFKDIGAYGWEAFYYGDNRTIYVDADRLDVKPEQTQQMLEQEAYEESVFVERDRKEEQLCSPSLGLSDDERRRMAADIMDAAFAKASQPGNLDSIPGDALVQSQERIRKKLQEVMYAREYKSTLSEMFITHEAFHDFFEHQLSEEGYQGPDQAEILARSLAGFRTRFKPGEVNYAGDEFISQQYDLAGVTDYEELLEKCKEITATVDITQKVPKIPNEQWFQMTEDEQLQYMARKQLHILPNEYMARVYNTITGVSEAEALEKLQAVAQKYNQPGITEAQVKSVVHDPLPGEQEMLEQMTWNGQSIMKRG